jgi:hypothetical protein
LSELFALRSIGGVILTDDVRSMLKVMERIVFVTVVGGTNSEVRFSFVEETKNDRIGKVLTLLRFLKQNCEAVL